VLCMLQRSLAHVEQLRNDVEIRRRVDERHRLEDERTAQAAAEVCICTNNGNEYCGAHPTM